MSIWLFLLKRSRFKHITLNHILHLAAWKSAKLVSGVKLAWTETFRRLVSSPHTWDKIAPTPCVSNLNLIEDHLPIFTPKIFVNSSSHARSFIQNHSYDFYGHKSDRLARLKHFYFDLCNWESLNQKYTRATILSFPHENALNRCLNECAHRPKFSNMNLFPSGIYFYLSVAICWLASGVHASWW